MKYRLKTTTLQAGQRRKLWFGLAVILLPLIGAGIYFAAQSPAPPTITNETITDITQQAKISGALPGIETPLNKLQAPAGGELSFQSKEIPIPKKEVNAVALEWKQDGDAGLDLEVRTRRDGDWTEWVDALQNEDRKDGSDTAQASTLVLANRIEDFQYRFILNGNETSPSSTVDLSDAKLTAIDSNAGPKKLGENKSLLSKLGAILRLSKPAHALADGPRIISRAEWGSPEPNSSPRWEPEYYVLGRAIVHHTVSTETPNALVAVRAIWDYHANGRGWGDIGYNYLVDSAGNIFQGRYFDTNYATQNSVEVEAGHTLGHNKGTIGIAAIGNFQNSLVPTPTLNAISEIIAFRFAPYNLNPVGNGPFSGPTIIGHRDHGSTACPGTHLYNQLPNIRVWTAEKAPRYANMHKMDYQYVSQRLYLNGDPIGPNHVFSPGDDVELAINLRNHGMETWTNTGSGAVRLGTRNPTDRASPFRHQTWPSKNRTGSFTGKIVDGVVEPASKIKFGETAQFRFKLNVPEIASPSGTAVRNFNEYFSPVIDGRAWFIRDFGIYQPIRVSAGSYTWQYQSQKVYTNSSMSTPVNPQNLARTERYFAVVRAKNTGTATWRQSSMRLGTAHPLDRSSVFHDSTWPGQNRAAILKESTVAPNSIGTFEFWITAPAGGFNGNEYFRPVADGVAWLNDLGLYFGFKTNP